MSTERDKNRGNGVSIKVVGVGRGGNHAVNHMQNSGMKGAEFLAIDTSIAALRFSKASLDIGRKLTKGMHTYGVPEAGEKAAEESREEIEAALKGADMVFIIAGMGGGTGTGAAPIIAEIARNMGSLTIGVVTRPFDFEGEHRTCQAEKEINKLKDKVDCLFVIPDDQLKYICPKITLTNAFEAADEVIRQAVQGITDLISMPCLINLDFVDVARLMKGEGFAHMGLGRAKGKDCVERAMQQAVVSPLLEGSLHGAKEMIASIRARSDSSLEDIDKAVAMLFDAASEKVKLLWGVSLDETMEDEVWITLIAAGFEEMAKPAAVDTAQASSTNDTAALQEELCEVYRLPGCSCRISPEGPDSLKPCRQAPPIVKSPESSSS